MMKFTLGDSLLLVFMYLLLVPPAIGWVLAIAAIFVAALLNYLHARFAS